MDNDNKTISRALASREVLLEIFVLAIILAFGINLLSTIVSDLIGSQLKTGLIGGVFIVLPCLYLISKLKRSLRTSTIVEAVVPFDISTNSVIDIPLYSFSEKVKKALRGAFVENSAFQTIWDNSPLIPNDETVVPFPSQGMISPDHGQINYAAIYETNSSPLLPVPHSAKFLIEAAEYLLFDLISDHLSDYFRDDDAQVSELRDFNGNDIPGILLTNRLLKLFTTPLEERPIYSKAAFPSEPSGAKIKFISGSDGSIFTTFGLTLPQRTTVSRPDNEAGKVSFESSRVSTAINISYSSERGIPPNSFVDLYLGKRPDKVVFLKIKIALDIKVPLLSLFRINGWKYYKWADSIPTKLIHNFEFSSFLKRLNWDQVRAQARVRNILKMIEENNAVRSTTPENNSTPK